VDIEVEVKIRIPARLGFLRVLIFGRNYFLFPARRGCHRPQTPQTILKFRRLFFRYVKRGPSESIENTDFPIQMRKYIEAILLMRIFSLVRVSAPSSYSISALRPNPYLLLSKSNPYSMNIFFISDIGCSLPWRFLCRFA
jgi:hypothetical protein